MVNHRNVCGKIAFSFLVFAVFTTSLWSQVPGNWHDPSKHKVNFVTVEDGVRLEVLDWGGSGRPVVLLAGYLTAHVYDEFAPKLVKACSCHVYGITRRGYGASSHPGWGYAAQEAANDVIKVLDLLRLKSPVLMGHSFGGQDITNIATANSDRIAGIVYLNSAEDATLVMADYGVTLPDLKKLPTSMREPPPPDYSSFQAYRTWQLKEHGVAFPEAELRNLFVTKADGSLGGPTTASGIRDAIFAGRRKPDFAKIRVPVLAFFSNPPASFETELEKYKPKNGDERTAMEQQFAVDLAVTKRHIQDLRTGVPAARVIELPAANYYIFLSNDVDIFSELRVFMGTLRSK